MITLPWPPSCLSPNTRTDRRATTASRAKYRSDALILARMFRGEYHPHLSITFHPPDKRKRDLDNMLGSIKYGLDGIAAGLGVDDYNWSITIARGKSTMGGAVIVKFVPAIDVAVVKMMGQIS